MFGYAIALASRLAPPRVKQYSYRRPPLDQTVYGARRADARYRFSNDAWHRLLNVGLSDSFRSFWSDNVLPNLNTQLNLTSLHVDLVNVVRDPFNHVSPPSQVASYWRQLLGQLTNLRTLTLVHVEEWESMEPVQFLERLFDGLLLPRLTKCRDGQSLTTC